MAIIDQKVSTIYGGVDIASLGDRPNEDGLSSAQLKARFDLLPKEVVSKYNGLIDLLVALLSNGTSTTGHTHNIDNIVDGLTYKLYSLVEQQKLSGIANSAEVNQNAFSNVKVNATTLNASSKTDTFELVEGLNIVMAVDALTKKITLSAVGDIATEAVQSMITDIGDYYTSLHVEGALQEIGVFLFNKVDKVDGKGLSTNDYDNIEKSTLAKLDNIPTITKEPTGFTNNSGITVSYNSTTRKITLTGSFEAYYQGNKITALVSGWESPAHADVNGTYYLHYNGTSFVFNTTPWSFDAVMIAFVQYSATDKLGLREVHGLMPVSVHETLHKNIGSYKESGGDFSGFTLNSTTATNRRPQISLTEMVDEDLKTSLPAITTNAYTQRYLVGASAVRTFATSQTEMIANNGTRAFWNQFTGGAWQQTLFGNNEYGAIFVIAVPVASDVGSQAYRYMFVQPQQVSTSLDVINALTPNNVNLGDVANLTPEFVFIGKIIILASVTSWTIISVAKLEGTKISQVAIQGNFLSVVTTDSTLSGLGTVASPLAVAGGGGQLLGTATVKAISYNAQVINENITIPATYNAMSVGDVSVGNGFTVTLETGSVWKVI